MWGSRNSGTRVIGGNKSKKMLLWLLFIWSAMIIWKNVCALFAFYMICTSLLLYSWYIFIKLWYLQYQAMIFTYMGCNVLFWPFPCYSWLLITPIVVSPASTDPRRHWLEQHYTKYWYGICLLAAIHSFVLSHRHRYKLISKCKNDKTPLRKQRIYSFFH